MIKFGLLTSITCDYIVLWTFLYQWRTPKSYSCNWTIIHYTGIWLKQWSEHNTVSTKKCCLFPQEFTWRKLMPSLLLSSIFLSLFHEIDQMDHASAGCNSTWILSYHRNNWFPKHSLNKIILKGKCTN